MTRKANPQRIEERFLSIVEEADNLTSRKLQAPPKPTHKAERTLKMHLTFRDGFNFGCGFFVANFVAALILGLIVFALTMVSTAIGLAGLLSTMPGN